jgi:hypothetical protein
MQIAKNADYLIYFGLLKTQYYGHKDRLISLLPSCTTQIAEGRTGAQMGRQKQRERERSLFQSSRPEGSAAADYAFFIMSLFLCCCVSVCSAPDGENKDFHPSAALCVD